MGKRSRVFKSFSLKLLLAFIAPLGCVTDAKAQSAGLNTPKSTVQRYLFAWERGDYAAMHKLLTGNVRRQATPDQIRQAFTLTAQTPTERQTAGTKPFKVGRPARIVSTRARHLDSRHATVECRAVFNVTSESGVDYRKVFPRLMQEAKKRRQGFVAAGLALSFGPIEKGKLLNTAQKQARSFTGKTGEKFVTLDFHRYALVKEEGRWRIANALRVSAAPPIGTIHLYRDKLATIATR